MTAILPVHRLAATDLLLRATDERSPMPEEVWEDIKSDFADLLAKGHCCAVRASKFGEGWEYQFWCPEKETDFLK